jgi:hypothetical protein
MSLGIPITTPAFLTPSLVGDEVHLATLSEPQVVADSHFE